MQEFDVTDLIRLLWKRKSFYSKTTLICLCLGVLVVLLSHKQYTSVSLLFPKPRTNSDQHMLILQKIKPNIHKQPSPCQLNVIELFLLKIIHASLRVNETYKGNCLGLNYLFNKYRPSSEDYRIRQSAPSPVMPLAICQVGLLIPSKCALVPSI